MRSSVTRGEKTLQNACIVCVWIYREDLPGGAIVSRVGVVRALATFALAAVVEMISAELSTCFFAVHIDDMFIGFMQLRALWSSTRVCLTIIRLANVLLSYHSKWGRVPEKHTQ